MAGISVLGLAIRSHPAISNEPSLNSSNSVNALLLSATTLSGKSSLEHGYKEFAELYRGRKNILLINFASLPADRDAYERRMQKAFLEIGSGFRIRSLHHASVDDAANIVREAEAFYVSGGNTFLLLRELYDRKAVYSLRERTLGGVPYGGSSAGSNIAGLEIGTTNDFPLVDVPTRRSLGLLPADFNPHHPSPETEKELFDGRQWKLRNYCKYHTNTLVVGVTNPGMIRIKGESITLLGDDASAFVHLGNRDIRVNSGDGGDLRMAFSRLQNPTSH